MSEHGRDRILRKIKSCLRLGASTNRHEAAAALRQAQAMMREHGITHEDLLASEASEASTQPSHGRSPPGWECYLSQVIADAFACSHIHSYAFVSGRTRGIWKFIGCGANPELASFAFTVLHRQLKSARAGHIKSKLQRCGPRSKTRRADVFCLGWIMSVADAVERFAMDTRQREAIELYTARHYPNLSTLQPIDRVSEKRGSADMTDLGAGLESGSGVDLRKPMKGKVQEALS